MLKCFVVDDEQASVEIISDYIDQTDGLILLKASTNPFETLNIVTGPVKPDIAFLDIDMPGINGLELASIIGGETAVIFITSHPQYAVDAFEKAAIDYLLKPVSYKRFMEAVMRVKKRQSLGIIGDRAYFFVKGMNKGEIVSIHFSDLIYVEALHHYVRLHTLKNKHITYLSLKEMEEKLSTEDFIRIHKSSVVNIRRIRNIEGNTVIMENDDKLIIGRTYRASFMKVLETKLFITSRHEN